MKMRSALLLARLRWLFIDPWVWWMCICLVLVSGIFIYLCPAIDPEWRARCAGTALQVFGLGTTVLGIQQTRKLFGHRSIFTRVKGWFERWPKRDVTVHLGAGAMVVTGGSAILSVGRAAAPPGASIEQRVQRLEEWLPLLEQRDNAIEQQLNDEKANRAQTDEEERKARAAADARLGERLELSATGGLRLSAVGLIWLMSGTVLAGFAPEIAALIQHASGSGATHSVSALNLNWQIICGWVYFSVAFGFSAFYSANAIKILTDADEGSIKGARLFHQRWLNFLGSATGWLCLWFVAVKIWHHILNGTDPAIGWPYAALALVAFVGVTGYLPFTVVKLINSIAALVEKIAGVFKPRDS